MEVLLPPAPPTNTVVVDIIVNSEDHTLLEAVVLLVWWDVLSAEGPFTVFAQTDEAIVALTETLGNASRAVAGIAQPRDILRYQCGRRVCVCCRFE